MQFDDDEWKFYIFDPTFSQIGRIVCRHWGLNPDPLTRYVVASILFAILLKKKQTSQFILSCFVLSSQRLLPSCFCCEYINQQLFKKKSVSEKVKKKKEITLSENRHHLRISYIQNSKINFLRNVSRNYMKLYLTLL